MFSTLPKRNLNFPFTFILLSANAFNLDQCKIFLFGKELTHYHTVLHFDALIYIAVENFVRKGEIAYNKQFLLFSQCFLPYVLLIFHFKCTLKCLLLICFDLDQFKILSSGNEVKRG